MHLERYEKDLHRLLTELTCAKSQPGSRSRKSVLGHVYNENKDFTDSQVSRLLETMEQTTVTNNYHIKQAGIVGNPEGPVTINNNWNNPTRTLTSSSERQQNSNDATGEVEKDEDNEEQQQQPQQQEQQHQQPSPSSSSSSSLSSERQERQQQQHDEQRQPQAQQHQQQVTVKIWEPRDRYFVDGADISAMFYNFQNHLKDMVDSKRLFIETRVHHLL
ncbi:unnamed protein product [Absidia cylindrospora]